MADKNRILRISLLITQLAAAFLCVYTLWYYSSHQAAPAPSGTGFHHSISSAGGQMSNVPGHTTGGRFPDSHPTQQSSPSGRIRGGMTVEDSQYAPLLISYAVVFLVLFFAVYYFYSYKKIKLPPAGGKVLILTLLCVGLLLRISASTLINGHPFDINTFKGWATAAANNLFQVYSGPRPSDYPPLYMYILFLIGKLASIPAISPYYILLLKLPSELADMVTALLLYKLAKKYLSLEISILAAAFYLFNPAVMINSTIWGQVDSFFTMLVTLSLYCLAEKKLIGAAALFTAAVLMKPQGIIFLPVLFFELVRQRNWKHFFKAAACSLLTGIVILLPFALNQGALWIFKLFSGTVAEYPYASVNAFNFFSLIGKNFASDSTTMLGFSYHSWGMFFIVLITVFSWIVYHKGNSVVFAPAAALLLIAGVFTFSTSMHERYLFPAVALSILAVIYLRDKRLLPLTAGFSATVYVNTHVVLFETIGGIDQIAYNPALIIISLVNVSLFIYLVLVLRDIAFNKKISAIKY